MPIYSYTRKTRPDSGLMSANDRHDDSGGADEDKRLGILVQEALPGKVFRIKAEGFGADSLEFHFVDTLTSEEQTTLADVVSDYTPKNSLIYVPPSASPFDIWEGEDVTAHFKFVNGVFTEVKSGNIDLEATGTITEVNGWPAVQFDGITEFGEFAPNSAYFAGGDGKKKTVDLFVRIDNLVDLKVFAGIADEIFIDDDADTFLMQSHGNKYRGRYRFLAGNQKNSIGTTVLVNGTTYHLRQTFDTTTGVQIQSVFNGDMSTTEKTTTLALNDTLVNAGTRPFTFGALSGGGSNAAITVAACMVRTGVFDGQHPDF